MTDSPIDRNSNASAYTKKPLTVVNHKILSDILDLLSASIFVIAADQRVIWMNRRGRSFLEADLGLSLNRDRLRGETPTQSREIEEIVRRANTLRDTDEGSQPTAARVITRRTAVPYLHLVAIGLPNSVADHDLTVLIAGTPQSQPINNTHLLRMLFQLTPAEARVAAALANGLSLSETAQELGLGIGTARWHLKRILSSTETRRQAELVRVILLSPLGLIAT